MCGGGVKVLAGLQGKRQKAQSFYNDSSLRIWANKRQTKKKNPQKKKTELGRI